MDTDDHDCIELPYLDDQVQLLRRNVELRLTEIQLRLEIESWRQAAANWQQVAIAAVAKADALERQLNQNQS